MTWDLFISYASEDRGTVAEPLAKALTKEGLNVWFDRFVLILGDSLRETIDDGLSKSRYGAVILSPNFFNKAWPQKELNALVEREVVGVKVILPVWHNVTHSDVAKFSPILADKLAISTSRGIEKVVSEIKNVVKPNIEEKRSYIIFGTINPFTKELTVDGQVISKDALLYIKDNRLYVSVRQCALVLGVKEKNILWDDNTQSMTLIKGNRVVQVKVGEDVMMVNGISVIMDIEPIKVDDEIMMSASYIAQSLGGNVMFDQNMNTIIFSSYRQ